MRELRSRLDLPERDPTQPAWLTARGAAQVLGISPAYAGLLLKRGIIPGTQAVPGSMWWVDPTVLHSPQLRATLRALSERRRVKQHHDDRTLQIPGITEGVVASRSNLVSRFRSSANNAGRTLIALLTSAR